MEEKEAFRRRMQEMMGDPGRWDSIDPDALKQLAYYQFLLFGTSREMSMVPDLGRLYAVVARRVPEEDRLTLLDYVALGLETNVGGVNSFLPFIFGDPEVSVIAEASVRLAVLMPLKEGDPMTGPETLRRMADNASDETAMLGILIGLLHLGDRRTLPLLYGCWKRLGRSARGRLAAAWPGVAYASQVDFLIGWMEDDPDGEDARAAGRALAGIPGRAGAGKVIDVERKFPANAPDGLPAARVVGEWTFAEYGGRIGSRLAAIPEERVGREVALEMWKAWGLPPG